MPLPAAGSCSEEFRDFVRQCMQKDPLRRPSAEGLLSHPFILKARRSACTANHSPEGSLKRVLPGGICRTRPLRRHGVSPCCRKGLAKRLLAIHALSPITSRMEHQSCVACLVADGWGWHVAQHARRRIDLRPYLRELANPDDRCGCCGASCGGCNPSRYLRSLHGGHSMCHACLARRRLAVYVSRPL